MHFAPEYDLLVSFSQAGFCGLMARWMWWGSNGREGEELSRKRRWYEIVYALVKEFGLLAFRTTDGF